MPYIPPDQRAELDPLIEQLAKCIATQAERSEGEAAFAGILNYSMSALALTVIRERFGKIRYWILATTVGVFHNAADELYRRLGAPYEDAQIEKNGDLELYQRLR